MTLIRQVESSDRPRLERLFATFEIAAYSRYFHPHPFDSEGARAVSEYLGADYYCVAQEGDDLVSYGMLRGYEAGFEIPSLGLAVAPQGRGTGLAVAMMSHLHSVAAARGSTAVRLKVYPQNEAALQFYIRLGYTFTGARERGQLVGLLSL